MDFSKRWKGLRDAEPTSKSGKCVEETDQLSGEAKDSLSGKNATVQYETSNPEFGKLGGKSEDN
jgi:hypothetical protein